MLKIYHYDISGMSDEEFEKMYLASDKNRQAKADKLKKDPAKKLSIASGELARRIIAEKFNIDKEDVRFRVDKSGKPYIEGIDVNFSISHSGTIALCAIADAPVGVDIEKIRDVDLSVAKKHFAPDEQDYVFEKLGLSKQRFFEVWTRKEAYVKMIGKGISYFPEFSTMGDARITTHVRNKYIISVITMEKDG